MDINRLEQYRQEIDRALAHYLSRAELSDGPEELCEAIRYATLGGGKRIRPLLMLAVDECCGGQWRQAVPFACAVEMIHAASLALDDLPAMDGDGLRRDRPSLYRVDGEALAIISGVALVAYAFQIASAAEVNQSAGNVSLPLSIALGAAGMCGGQVIDLRLKDSLPNQEMSRGDLEALYLRKSAALMAASAEIGAITAGSDADRIELFRTFGQQFGLAFQIIDDVVDCEADRAVQQPTYATLYGVDEARIRGFDAMEQALEHIRPFGDQARLLHELADTVLQQMANVRKASAQ